MTRNVYGLDTADIMYMIYRRGEKENSNRISLYGSHLTLLVSTTVPTMMQWFSIVEIDPMEVQHEMKFDMRSIDSENKTIASEVLLLKLLHK